MEKSEILKNAITINGVKNQLVIVMEESSELQKECSKLYRDKGNIEHLIEEMADMYICLEELQIMFNISTREIDNNINFKVSRLEERNNKK